MATTSAEGTTEQLAEVSQLGGNGPGHLWDLRDEQWPQATPADVPGGWRGPGSGAWVRREARMQHIQF